MTAFAYAPVPHGPQQDTPARGVLFLHSCPRAVTSHICWALGAAVEAQVTLDWSEQPIEPGTMRAELLWSGPAGTAAKMASALVAFPMVRFEVTEEPVGGRGGERFASTPNLGMFRGDMGEYGDILVPEERLRSALAAATSGTLMLAEQIARLVGEPWDRELEPYRFAHEGSTVRVLTKVV